MNTTTTPPTSQIAEGRTKYNEIKERGAIGYIMLGSLVVDLIEREKNSDLEHAANALSLEQISQLSAWAREHLEEEVVEALKERQLETLDELWVKAMDGGLRSTLSDYRRGANDNFETLFKELSKIEKTVKFSSGFWHAIIISVTTTILIAFLVFAVENFLDTPLTFQISPTDSRNGSAETIEDSPATNEVKTTE